MRKQTGKDLVVLLTLTIITAVVWVGLEIYRTFTRVPPPTGTEELLRPLNPTLNMQVFNDLEQRNP